MTADGMPKDIDPLRDIVYRALVKYLNVRPTGFALHGEQQVRATIEARILGFGGARTLYKNRKPSCRSLDGIQPVIGDTKRLCRSCKVRDQCTPQVRLDLLVGRQAYRLLLAYSSAQSFLAYDAQLRQRALTVEAVRTIINVVNRGSWGELRFRSRD